MELSQLPARTETGEIKRIYDVRGENQIVSGKNRGHHKGKELEQSRIVYSKTCLNCFFKFEGIAKAKYCSESCKQKAKRYRAKYKPKVYKQVELF